MFRGWRCGTTTIAVVRRQRVKNFGVFFLIRVYLLTGQFSVRSISAFSLSFSWFTRSQSYNIWYVFWSPILQGHIGLSIILYLYRFDVMLPWPVTIIVRFGVTLIFSFNLLRRNYIFNFSTSVYKMWIIQKPNTLDLWNKLHFEEEKTESIYHV